MFYYNLTILINNIIVSCNNDLIIINSYLTIHDLNTVNTWQDIVFDGVGKLSDFSRL